MKKLTPFLASALMAIALIAPQTSLAKDNDISKEHDEHHSFLNTIGTYIRGTLHVAAATKPDVKGITAPTVLTVGQEGTWTVRASEPNDGPLTYAVDWGDSASGARMMAPAAFVQTSTFTHSYDHAGTYTVQFSIKNEAGAVTKTSASVLVKDGTTQHAPVITKLAASKIREKQATITWMTDTRANGSIWYTTTSPVDTTGAATVTRPGMTKKHKIVLTDLTPGTTYFVITQSTNADGSTKSSEISFTTKAVADATPVIESINTDTTITAGDTATLTVLAHDPNNRPLSYSVDWGDVSMLRALLATTAVTQTTTFEHTYDTPGTYTAVVTAENDTGQKTSKSIAITVAAVADTTAPVITNAAVTATPTSATISWNTDEAATSLVSFDTVTPRSTDAKTVENTALVTTHALDLTGLTANTRYYFTITSHDAANNSVTTTESSFMTGSTL